LGLVSCDNRKDAPKCEEIEGLNGFKSKQGQYNLPYDLNNKYTLKYYPQYEKHRKYTGVIKICENNKVYIYGNYVDGKLNGKVYDFTNDYDAHLSDKYLDFNLFALFRKPKLSSIKTYNNGHLISYKPFKSRYKPIDDIIGILITPFSLFLIFILYKRKRKQQKTS